MYPKSDEREVNCLLTAKIIIQLSKNPNPMNGQNPHWNAEKDLKKNDDSIC